MLHVFVVELDSNVDEFLVLNSMFYSI